LLPKLRKNIYNSTNTGKLLQAC